MKWQKVLAVLLLLALLLGAALPTAPPTLAQSTQFPSKESTKAVMARVNDYWLATTPYPGDNRWERAAYMTGNLAHYQTVGDPRYLDAAVTWAQSHNWQLNGGCATQFADNHAAAQSYLDLARLGTPGASLDCTIAAMQASMTWAWLELDLGSVQTIQQVNLYPFAERAYRYYVQVKTTPDAPYVTVVNRSANTTNSPLLTDTFAPVAARFVKLWVVGAYNYIGWLGNFPPVAWVGIKELEVLDSANSNIALNQPVTCSNTPEPQNPCGSAVDGIRNNNDNRWTASLYSAFVQESPNWWWIDAMFMAMPVYAKLGKDRADPTYHEVMYVRYQDAKENRGLYDPAAGLWYRDANYLYPGVATPSGAKVFWSRGNGWVFAALARTLSELPPTNPHYNEYLATFHTMAAALKAVQRPEGYWNSSLADPNHFPGPESSGTAFFTYGLAWGINHGYLDAATYGEPVVRAWQWLVTAALHPDGKVGYVQPVGERPGPATYDDTMAYGVGAFLLAGSELYKLGGDSPVAQNLALNKPVVCSSAPEPENACANVVNGNLFDRWSATPYPQWVEGVVQI